MSGTENDVIGGFKTVIDEQKAVENGTCAVSFYKFADKVEEVYKGKDVNEVEYLDGKYRPGGCTALFDAVGTAIDKIGEWLDNMKEEDKPEKNIVVVMTDGGENSSREYSASKVKEMIKHQEDKYNWTFVYMGSDLTDATDANTLGFGTRVYSSKTDYLQHYDIINCAVSSYRCSDENATFKSSALNSYLKNTGATITEAYAKENGLSSKDLLDNED
jgi:hypothetical protein